MNENKNETASRVIKGGIAILFVQACTIVLYFLSQRIILSFLTKEENGFLFAERRMVDLLLVVIVDFGLNGIVLRKIIQEPERTGVLLSSLVAFRFVMWLFGTALCVSIAIPMGQNVMDIAMWCLFLLLTTRSGLMRYALELPYRAKVQLKTIGAIALLDPVVFFFLVFLYRNDLSPSMVILLFMLSAIPGFVMMVLLDKGRLVRIKNVEFAEIKRILVAALPILASIILINLHDKIDAMLLDWLTNPTQVGIFGAAYTTLSPITGTIPLALSAAVVPIVARLVIPNPEEGKKYVWTAVRLLIAVSVSICAVASLATPVIVELISQGRYSDNISQFFVFLWMPIPIFLVVFIQELIIVYNQQKLSIPISATLAVVVIIAGLILIPMYGAMGAIIAKFLSVSLASILAIYYLHKILADKAKVGLIVRALILIAFGVSASLVLPMIFSIPVAIIICAIAVFGACFAFGMIRVSDIRLITSVLNRKKS
ncbi:MAG: oligosaccharide flippase family protein [Ignavibacteria bacterium]|nr:oligosaccharide flippase family protein [Ignavibacteria bacterium]